MQIPLAQRLLTVEEYQKMAEVGILTEEDRVELLDGKIVNMSPSGHRHATMVKQITALFYELLAKKVTISVQDSIIVNPYSMAEPDVAILKYSPNSYKGALPKASDVLLVIEVADSTQEKDRKLKAPLYASAGIPEYWIVDVERNQIEICREPHEGQYRLKEVVRPGGVIEPTGLGVRVEVEGLFG